MQAKLQNSLLIYLRKMQNIELIVTGDGSHTLYNKALNENYHSVHGAINESLHVFIKNGIAAIGKKELTILEIGFGTGLNALLTYHYAIQHNIKVKYRSIELYPLDFDVINALNYPSVLDSEYKSLFEQIHNAPWNSLTKLHPLFSIDKLEGSIHTLMLKPNIDLVYFDAFAPEKQPDMWTFEVFLKVKKLLNNNAILVTYCAKGIIKRILKDVGFNVKALQGPPGKREMTRAEFII